MEGYRSYNEKDKSILFDRARQYLDLKKYSAKTFEENTLKRNTFYNNYRQERNIETQGVWSE